MQETGLRNSGYGADKFGFEDLSAVHWNLTAPVLYEHAIAAREAAIVEGGALCAETGVHTGRSPKDKHTVVDALTESTVWWDGNRKMSQSNFQLLYDGYDRACARQDAVRAGSAWRRRSELPDQDSRLHRACLAFPFHSSAADSSRSVRARRFRTRAHHCRSALVQGRPRAPRRSHRHHHRHRLHQEDHPHRQFVLCRRDEEIGFHHAQLLSAGTGRDADALLGQRRQEWRCGAVLRPVRHRQDHALGRPRPHADRRR